MDSYRRKRFFKLLLFMLALGIGAFILWYSNNLAHQLKEEEYKRMKLWSEATRVLSSSSQSEEGSIGLVLEVISQNNTIPVMLCDTLGNILFHRNLGDGDVVDSTTLFNHYESMKAAGNLIVVDLGDGDVQHLYYSDSSIIKQLTRFPYVQMGLVSVFVLLAYFVFSGARRAEQNRVWVGMAKETAHQLGTPTSSLLGWVDLLRMKGVAPDLTDEMAKDLLRLQNVADRFSKIGSRPDLQLLPLYPIVENLVAYLARRSSGKVHMQIFPKSDKQLAAMINPVLFEWVLENILKNALDAVGGEGRIDIFIHGDHGQVFVDIADNGKGMKRNQSRRIFDAGFTTKKRGWGLGMTLAKRIVQDYHEGKIFVKESELGRGTTIRIVLPGGGGNK